MAVSPDKLNEYVEKNLTCRNELVPGLVDENRDFLMTYLKVLGMNLDIESGALGAAFDDREKFVEEFGTEKERKRWDRDGRSLDWRFARLHRRLLLRHDYNWYVWHFWMAVLANIKRFKYQIYADSSNLVLESRVVKPLYDKYRHAKPVR